MNTNALTNDDLICTHCEKIRDIKIGEVVVDGDDRQTHKARSEKCDVDATVVVGNSLGNIGEIYTIDGDLEPY